MSDIFISYARSTEPQAICIAEALRALGYGVWRDDDLPAHRAYSDVIEERLKAAKAVVVVWSAEAAKSHWVRAEADAAREAGTLVQLRLDGALPPMPFNQIQCADMIGWSGDIEALGWLKVIASVADLVGTQSEAETPAVARPSPKLSICVLPFANMSGDAEQEYFSDGTSEDIITDLCKVSALSVTARNTAFQFKGKSIDVPKVARQLNVSHLLEGSVRKAGGRVRITAQLIDGATGNHLWAERYDRDLADIFALQDEVSETICKALKLKLLPQEKHAIERRGTDSAEAYDLYLMARQHKAAGELYDQGHEEAIVRLTRRAVEIDPAYARAWALMGSAQTTLRFRFGRSEIDSWASVEKALALDPGLAEALALKATHLRLEGRIDEALTTVQTALELDPDSWDVNYTAAYFCFSVGRFSDAIPYFERAAALMETDVVSAGLLITCHNGLGNEEGSRCAARMTIARAEAVLAQDRGAGVALGWGAIALAVLGEADRARDWIRRALLIDPDNLLMRYNLACALCAYLKETEAALDLLVPYFANVTVINDIPHPKIDPDLKAIRDDPRFLAMLAAAEARLEAQVEVSTGT